MAISVFEQEIARMEAEALALKTQKEHPLEASASTTLANLNSNSTLTTKKTSVSLTVLEDVYASSQAVICTLTPSSTDSTFMSCAYIDATSLGYTLSSSTGVGNVNTPMFIRVLADNSKHVYRFSIAEYSNESVSLPTTLTYTLTFLATSDFSLTTSYETIDWAG